MRVTRQHLLLEAERRRRRAVSEMEKEERRGRIRESFRECVRFLWPILNPGTPLVEDTAFDAAVQAFGAFYAVKRKSQYMMTHFPPGSAKTQVGIVMGGVWRWINDPTWGFLSASNAKNFALHSEWTKDIIQHPSFQELFPLSLKQDSRSKDLWRLDQGGWRFAVNYLSGFDGAGAHDLAGDDIQTADDLHNRPRCRKQEEKLLKGFWSRLRDKETGGMLLIGQRNGPFDIYNYARLAAPNMWDVVAVEARKTSVLVAPYYKQEKDGKVTRVEMPLRTRPDIWEDPRNAGELLSARMPESYLSALPLPSFQAQQQQQPILETSEGARLHMWERSRNLVSFAAYMGAPSLRAACMMALRQGWYAKSSWDHGLDAGREWAGLWLINETLRRIALVGVYVNARRTVPQDDARGFRAVLDSRGVPPNAVIYSKGDVGTVVRQDEAVTTNDALEAALDEHGRPYLGFSIGLPNKGAGSVASGTELLNWGFASGTVMFDESCEPAAVAVENWTGGEAYKDGVDMMRYGVEDELSYWMSAGSTGGFSAA